MKVKFRDVSSGIVEARATIELEDGIIINEVTIINKNNDIIIEIPQKSFKGKDNKIHYLDIISFENENKKIIWMLEIKNLFLKWRKENKKVLVYEK